MEVQACPDEDLLRTILLKLNTMERTNTTNMELIKQYIDSSITKAFYDPSKHDWWSVCLIILLLSL